METKCTSLPGDYENLLESYLLHNTASQKKRVYICSPCSAPTKTEVFWNMKAARVYMYCAAFDLEIVPKAPHAYLPFLVDDYISKERELGLDFGLELLAICKELHVCGNRITFGMSQEIIRALKLGMLVTTSNISVFSRVRMLQETQRNGSVGFYKHPHMGQSPEQIIKLIGA